VAIRPVQREGFWALLEELHKAEGVDIQAGKRR